MARPVILGNGSLTVGLDQNGLVHDFYYPYVGLENMTTARSMHHKIGVWVDGVFTWVDDETWNVSVDFEENALISDVTMFHDSLKLSLHFKDFVDTSHNVFCRYFTVTNDSDTKRDIRIFMHQVFEISRNGRADTALYEPESGYILDYKGRCNLLISGQSNDGTSFDQFAVGNYAIEGKEGTFRDAEDGELSGNAVEHGGVDSVLRFQRIINPHEYAEYQYWVVAADSQYDAEVVHERIKKQGLLHRLQHVRSWWEDWLAIGARSLHSADPRYIPMVKKSLMVLKAHVDRRGGIIASCDSSIYNYGRDYYSYVWPRDGAYAIWPLIRMGYTEEPEKFFEFCGDIVNPEGYMMHKYQPDRSIGSTWHPLVHGKHKELAIQEDETAIVLFMLGEYYEYSKNEEFVRTLFAKLIRPAAQFLADYIDDTTGLPHASYDLWEEKFLTTTYTTATVYQALLVAVMFAEAFDYPDEAQHWKAVSTRILHGAGVFFNPDKKTYRKGFLLDTGGSLQFDDTLDVSSSYGIMTYGLYTDPVQLHESFKRIEEILLDASPSGGSPRYENDAYFRKDSTYLGNPWVVTTLWLAQYYIKTHQADKARHYIEWALKCALPSGVMSEQVDPVDATTLSVTPLVWSHAEFINTILDLSRI